MGDRRKNRGEGEREDGLFIHLIGNIMDILNRIMRDSKLQNTGWIFRLGDRCKC